MAAAAPLGMMVEDIPIVYIYFFWLKVSKCVERRWSQTSHVMWMKSRGCSKEQPVPLMV